MSAHLARRKWLVRLGEELGDRDCPFMRRWVLETPWFSIRLHHFLLPDRNRHLHDHPWAFVTLLLRGGYVDESACPSCADITRPFVAGYGCPLCKSQRVIRDELRPGSIRYRPALWRHRVVTDDAWTLVLTGAIARIWGFWVDGRFEAESRYFALHGHAPCE